MNWAITSLIDKKDNSQKLIIGNVFSVRYDSSDIYRFGFEEGCGFDLINIQIVPGNAVIVENSTLRISVTTYFTVNYPLGSNTYSYTYTLIPGEPFLRIQLTGLAINYSTVFTSFRFPSQITRYIHGTPSHWDYKTPYPYGLQPDFQVTMEAVHDFIIPESNGIPLSAIYPSATPAWGVLGDTLYGAVLRNSPSDCGYKGAAGSDPSVHTIHYAIRVPGNLSHAQSGQPLREARLYQSPLRAVYMDQIINPSAGFSFFSVTNTEAVLVNTVKRGSKNEGKLILRIYNPSNGEVMMNFQFNSLFQFKQVNITTALEEDEELGRRGKLVVLHDEQSYSFLSKNALGTLSIQ